jgi:hypothetical protein
LEKLGKWESPILSLVIEGEALPQHIAALIAEFGRIPSRHDLHCFVISKRGEERINCGSCGDLLSPLVVAARVVYSNYDLAVEEAKKRSVI